MSLLPEEFPVVLTIFLAMGAWRIAQVGVLTRQTSAIETMGAATVLCTDKTGTLTQNRMTVADCGCGRAAWRAPWPNKAKIRAQARCWAWRPRQRAGAGRPHGGGLSCLCRSGGRGHPARHGSGAHPASRRNCWPWAMCGAMGPIPC
jgi:hypothetical protein